MTTTIEALVNEYRDALHVQPYGDGELLLLPATFVGGEPVEVLITRDGTHISVTDRGTAADALADVGVDLSGRARKSFEAIVKAIDLSPAFGAEWWEISVSTDQEGLAAAIQAVSDASMRADGLRALGGGRRRRSFGDVVVNAAAQHTAVVPRASMATRRGDAQRQVTLKFDGRREGEQFYLQALSSRDAEARSHAYDHASGLFLAAEPDQHHRVALLQDGPWERWQEDALRDVCEVVHQSEMEAYLHSVAAPLAA